MPLLPPLLEPVTEERKGRHRALLCGVVLLALLLHLPCLAWGFFIDDYGHQLILQGFVEHPTMKPWSLYDFGHFADVDGLQEESGSFPWWTSPEWKVRFFRPLASLSLWLDHAIWGTWAPGFHVSGLLLFAALLFVVHRLFRALDLSPLAALIALLILGCEDGSVISVGWPANRNTIVEALAATGALLGAVRFVRGGRRAFLLLALLGAGGAALAKESGVVVAPLVAWVLWRHRPAAGGPERTRGVGVVIIAALLFAVAHVAFLVASGYGANSLFYPAPWEEGGEVVQRLVIGVPVGTLAMVSPFTTDVFLLYPQLAVPALILALLVVTPLAVIVARSIRAHPAATVLGAWVLVTMLPQASAPLSDRLLFVSTIGVAGLLGLFVDRVLVTRISGGRGTRVIAALVLVSTVLLSGPLLLLRGVGMQQPIEFARSTILEAEVGPKELGTREAILLQSPTTLIGLHPIAVWIVEGGAEDPVRFWSMQLGRRGVRWTRLDERTFELESLDEPFLDGVLEAVYLTEAGGIEVGKRWETPLFEVEAVEVEGGALRRFRVRMAEGLEEPRYRFLTWREGRMRRVAPPGIGESVELARVPAPMPFSM